MRKGFSDSYKLYYEPYHQDDIRWNFEKFLIDERGQPVRRYLSALDPMEIVPDIDALLRKIQEEKWTVLETVVNYVTCVPLHQLGPKRYTTAVQQNPIITRHLRVLVA